jgi:hypothetical protein
MPTDNPILNLIHIAPLDRRQSYRWGLQPNIPKMVSDP